MVAVVDYGVGNLRSVANALERVEANYCITSDRQVIASADHVILPGVGAVGTALAELRTRGLETLVCDLKQPVLGICVGMQILCGYCEENKVCGLEIFPVDVRRFDSFEQKVPQMGWSTIYDLQTPLFERVDSLSWVYYVNSFAPDLCDQTVAKSYYGRGFSAALNVRNFYATQFHPEKSGAVGTRILNNFLQL